MKRIVATIVSAVFTVIMASPAGAVSYGGCGYGRRYAQPRWCTCHLIAGRCV